MNSLLGSASREGDERETRAVVERFFHHMDTRPEAARVRAMHRAELAPMVEKLSTFLFRWLAGRQSAELIPMAHYRFDIGPEERDAWLDCMRAALEDLRIDPERSADWLARLAELADRCRSDAASGDF